MFSPVSTLRLKSSSLPSRRPEHGFSSRRVVAVTFALVASVIVATAPSPVRADGHETVESLKATLAGMEKKFAALNKDRDSLYDQLLQTIEELEASEQKVKDTEAGRSHVLERFYRQRDIADAREDDLMSQVKQAQDSEAYLAERLEKVFADSKIASAREEELTAQVMQAQDSEAFLAERLEKIFADSKSQSADALAKEEKMSAEADSLAIIALTQIQSALAERDSAREELAAAQAANGRLARDIESTANGRDYIEKLLQKEKTASSSAVASAEARAKSAANGRKLARNRLVAMNDEVDALKNQLNFTRIQLAKIEGDLATAKSASMADAGTEAKSEAVGSGPSIDAAWASKVSSKLSASYRSISTVKVSELPGNRVGIRIGNAGLFETGASALSGAGQNLLSKLGQALREQSDARILILGHTDNIPVGNDSAYIDNTDLSNRRALSAMKYLGERVGITFSRMSSTGLADNYPIASNDNADGRAQNRRIELELAPL